MLALKYLLLYIVYLIIKQYEGRGYTLQKKKEKILWNFPNRRFQTVKRKILNFSIFPSNLFPRKE